MHMFRNWSKLIVLSIFENSNLDWDLGVARNGGCGHAGIQLNFRDTYHVVCCRVDEHTTSVSLDTKPREITTVPLVCVCAEQECHR